MFKRIDHVEIVPTDIDRTIQFYTDVLGFKVKERRKLSMPPIQEIAYLTLSDTMIELIAVTEPGQGGQGRFPLGYRMMALEVESMDQAVAYLESKGVAITVGPNDLGKSIRAEVCDPDGFSIELREWKH